MGVRLKNEWQSPIGGWQHTDASINSEPITEWSVNDLVQSVIARRRVNPRFGLSLDAATVKQDVMRQNADRMNRIRGGEHYLIQDDSVPGPAPGQQGFSPPHTGRRSVAARVRSVADGVGILIDWLGEGGQAVDLPVANERARICSDCPLNQAKDFLAYFTDPVAQKIRKQIAIKNEMELSTPYDEKLNICMGCGCSLRLKVFVPDKHIANHTSEEVKSKLDARCWVLALLK
jgi:hypothetical protein